MKELRLALVQTPLVWEDPKANQDVLAKKLQQLNGKADLIILPEMFTTGFTMAPENIPVEAGPLSVEWMGTMARKYDAGIMGSLVFSEKKQYFNRFFFVTPDGVQYHYDKRHTFTLAGEHHKYVAGREKVVCEFRDFRICPQICYDLRFPVWSRNTEDYDVLIYVANWPALRIGAWDTLLKARAIENMAYCVGVNRVGRDPNGHEYPGHTAVYDCLGEPLAFSEKEEIVYATLSKEHIEENRQRLQFLSDRDTFIVQ